MTRRLFAAAVLALVLVAGCSSVPVPSELTAPTSTVPDDTGGSPAPDCSNPEASERPTGPLAQNVSSARARQILDRGTLRVGVDTSTLRFGAVNPFTGDFEGFDIDLAREVTKRVLGDPARTEFVAIAYSDRVDAIVRGHVDVVVDTFTINCTRREKIDYSTTYFNSGHRVGIRSDNPATSATELVPGTRACAAEGSTSIETISAAPQLQLVTVPSQADCLVALQQSQVDAIVTDDTILAGLAAQDPNLKIVGDLLSFEPYGVGTPTDARDLTASVNAALAQIRSDGTWAAIWDRWLSALGPAPTPPQAQYR